MISTTLASVPFIFAAAIITFTTCSGSLAQDEKFYVLAKRTGCTDVKSEAPCYVSKISKADALHYEIYMKEVEDIVQRAAGTNANDSDCSSLLKTTLCSLFVPKCFEDGSRDYGNGSVICWKAKATCENPVVYDLEGICRSIPEGKHPLSSCVLPSSPINGSCPKPEYKMPSEKLNTYKRFSKLNADSDFLKLLKNARYVNNGKNSALNGTRMFSEECVTKLTDMQCMPVYCSADEKRLLAKYNWEECKRTMNQCFDKAIDNLSNDDDKELLQHKKQEYMVMCQFHANSTKIESPTGAAVKNYYYTSFFMLSLFFIF